MQSEDSLANAFKSKDELNDLWQVCSKVASSLESGERLENLSWYVLV